MTLLRLSFGRAAAISVLSLAAIGVLGLAGCTAPQHVDDPLGALAATDVSPRSHMGAMEQLDAQPLSEAYLLALHRMMYYPGFTPKVREAAFGRLVTSDEQKLKRTIRQKLPNMGAALWAERLCELIVEHDWVDLTPAIVSRWARPRPFTDDRDRYEYHALVALHGEDRVDDVVFDLFVESNKASQSGLRGRCWDLLQRLGHRDRLIALIADVSVGEDDPTLIDLRTVARHLDLMPANREELLWLRKLCESERAEFFVAATEAVALLASRRRDELEFRDLPIVVAAAMHEPPLLEAANADLYRQVAAHIKGSRVHIDSGRFEGIPGAYHQRLFQHRDILTWGDLAAMLMAVRAMRVPQVVEHLFDYADRDHDDRSCEYGGVIRLDDQGRFEILEFPPRVRRHDREFIASQAMMDAGYTAIFHFHFHAQQYRNSDHAGPGLGDVNYAENVRPNCLVFTFVNKDTLNVDYYRHGRVIVDLGEIKRP